jgi:integrase/recombinase XerC
MMIEPQIVQGKNGALTISGIITVDLYRRYITFIDAKPKTIETYTRALKQFFYYLSSKSIAQPTRQDILTFRDELRLTHKPTTVQNYITAVRLFFQWTEQEGLYKNVAEHIKGAKLAKEHKKDYLTSKQVRAVLTSIERETAQGSRDYAIFLLMLTGGLRTIEITRANLGDLRTVGDSVVLYVQGKGREEKTDYVKVPEQAEQAIRAWIKTAGITDPGQPLFTSEANKNKGTRLTTRSISRIVKTRLQQAGFDSERLTAHSLRHTAGTLNLINGGTLEETQQLLRHTNINTTMIYTHHLERAKNDSEARIARAIFV